MNPKTTLPGLALAAGLLATPALPHGGTYPGPGDTVPGGSGPGAGSGAPSGGAGPISPSGGTPTPGTPTTPGLPGAPKQPGVKPSSSGPTDLGPDLTHWSYWWDLNKAGFLNLRKAVHGRGPTTADDDFWIGQGQIDASQPSLAPTRDQVENTIVPALVRAMETETSNDIVTGCMLALAKIGDVAAEDGRSRFTELITPFLTSKNQEIAESAAIALGVLGHESAVPLLAGLLRDDARGREAVGSTEVSFRTRAFAAYGLALVADDTSDPDLRRTIVGDLAGVLSSDKSSTRDVQVACVISLGLVPLTATGGEPAHEVEVPTTFEEQIAFLQSYLADEGNPRLARAHVPSSLASLVGPTDSPQKEAVARDLLERVGKHSKESNDVLRGCTIALGLLGDRDGDDIDADVREALVSMRKRHSDQLTRNLSLIALGEVGGRVGTGDGSDDGLERITRYLEETLGGGKDALRPWAALGMGVLGYRVAESRDSLPYAFGAPLRFELERAKRPTELGAYAIAAGLLHDPQVADTLAERFGDLAEDEVRGLMAVALGMVGARGHIESIQQVVKASEYRPVLLRRSAIGLGLMGDKEIVDDLLGMLIKARSLSSQASICSALGFIGDNRSVDPLVTLLENEGVSGSARGFAAVSLGLVAARDELPWNFAFSEHLNYLSMTSSLNDPTGGGNGIVNIL